jgi:hypothetical protein
MRSALREVLCRAARGRHTQVRLREAMAPVVEYGTGQLRASHVPAWPKPPGMRDAEASASVVPPVHVQGHRAMTVSRNGFVPGHAVTVCVEAWSLGVQMLTDAEASATLGVGGPWPLHSRARRHVVRGRPGHRAAARYGQRVIRR